MKKNSAIIFFTITILVIVGTACSSNDFVQEKPSPIPSPEVTVAVTAEKENSALGLDNADMLIELRQANRQDFEIESGQVLRIKPPDIAKEWQLDYNDRLFELLTPQEKLRSPGEEGWLFRAIAQGSGSFLFTSIVSCENIEPCPMMPARLSLTVRVK